MKVLAITPKPKVAVFSSSRYVREFMHGPLEKICCPTFFESTLCPRTAHLAAGHTIVNVFVNDDLSAPVLDILYEEGVETITMRCAGFDKLDAQRAKELGFRVLRVPAYSPRSVAELALTHTMALCRNLQRVLPRVKNGIYTLDGLVGRELSGSTIGLVGTGKIAREFAKLIAPMAGRIIAYDIFEAVEAKELGIEYVSMDELLAQSDVVSLHCPLMESTYHLVDETMLSKMKPTAFLVNTARGGLVDSLALIHALENGTISGAALDVYEHETALFFSDRSSLANQERMIHWDKKFARLANLPNVIVSPHVAFLTNQALDNIVDTTVENISAAFWKESSSNDIIS